MSEAMEKAIIQSKEALPVCHAGSQDHIRVVTIIFEPGSRIGNRSSRMYVVSFRKKVDGDSFCWELETADEKPLFQIKE